jgi:phage shock protein A
MSQMSNIEYVQALIEDLEHQLVDVRSAMEDLLDSKKRLTSVLDQLKETE